MHKRLAFEREAQREYPSLRSRVIGCGREAQVVYALRVDVPEYEPRDVVIRFYNSYEPILKAVTVDGPTDSFHRYTKRTLCLWKADAPPDQRWLPEEGLAELIRIIRRHLFQEAWARDEGEWAGPERPHLRYPLQRGDQEAA